VCEREREDKGEKTLDGREKRGGKRVWRKE